MATLAVNTTSRSGTDLGSVATAAAGGGDKFPNTGVEMLYIKNGGGSPITLTMVFASGLAVDGVTPANKTVSVGAGVAMLIGPFPVTWYSDANGFVNFTYSGVTSVTVAAVKTGS